MDTNYEHTDQHAYLIIAHRNDYTFQTLLSLLDDERNDVFIHMDIKNRLYSPTGTEEHFHCSNVYHTPERLNVQWGGYSLIAAELLLLKTATSSGRYKYYHLLSGQDLPIKSQDYIHSFFKSSYGKEFVAFDDSVFKWQQRVNLYHIFQEQIGRKQSFPFQINNIFLGFQRLIGINRNKNVVFPKGANWFSITDDLAHFVLSKEDWIHKTFKYTQAADEIFLQTIVQNSEYVDRLYYPVHNNDPHAYMRLIDWKRGSPYIWQIENKLELQNSDLLFARKFDCEIDKNIIDYVANHLCNRNISR